MKIMLIVTTMSVGGVQSQVLLLADAHAEAGHDVRIVSLFGTDEVRSVHPGVKHHALAMGKSTPVAWFRGLNACRRLIRCHPIDLVHGHAFHASLFARLIGVVCGVPVISTIHSVQEGRTVHHALARLTFRLSAITTAVSSAVAESHAAKGGVKAGEVRVVPNGLNTRRFAPDPAERWRIRAELSLESGDTMLLSVGRLTEAKDIPNLLRAFELARSQGIGNARLFIAGDGPELPQVRRLIYDHGLDAAVELLGSRTDIPHLLNGADFLVLSSAWEGLPMIVGEAMASQTPVVATAVGGVPELLGDHGFLAPPNDSVALGAAIVAACRLDASSRQRMVESARGRILSRFEISMVREMWEELYSAIGAGARP